MKTNPRTRRGFTLVELLVVIVIIAALAGLTAPMVIRQRKKADQTEATSNARQIGLALFEFETAYGSFMDSTTATSVTPNTNQLTLGNSSSNDYFRQLIAADISQSEAMFYAKAAYTKKPDGVFNTSGTALAQGEVGFGYILNTDKAFSTAGNPSRPIIAAPLKYPFASEQFDKDYYDSKVVVLRIDNSVVSLTMDQTGKAVLTAAATGTTAKTLFQSGDDTVWGTGVTPTMVNPTSK